MKRRFKGPLAAFLMASAPLAAHAQQILDAPPPPAAGADAATEQPVVAAEDRRIVKLDTTAPAALDGVTVAVKKPFSLPPLMTATAKFAIGVMPGGLLMTDIVSCKMDAHKNQKYMLSDLRDINERVPEDQKLTEAEIERLKTGDHCILYSTGIAPTAQFAVALKNRDIGGAVVNGATAVQKAGMTVASLTAGPVSLVIRQVTGKALDKVSAHFIHPDSVKEVSAVEAFDRDGTAYFQSHNYAVTIVRKDDGTITLTREELRHDAGGKLIRTAAARPGAEKLALNQTPALLP